METRNDAEERAKAINEAIARFARRKLPVPEFLTALAGRLAGKSEPAPAPEPEPAAEAPAVTAEAEAPAEVAQEQEPAPVEAAASEDAPAPPPEAVQISGPRRRGRPAANKSQDDDSGI